MVGAVRRRVEPNHARRLGVPGAVEEQELDRAGLAREDAEVDAALDDGGAQRERPAGHDRHSPSTSSIVRDVGQPPPSALYTWTTAVS